MRAGFPAPRQIESAVDMPKSSVANFGMPKNVGPQFSMPDIGEPINGNTEAAALTSETEEETPIATSLSVPKFSEHNFDAPEFGGLNKGVPQFGELNPSAPKYHGPSFDTPAPGPPAAPDAITARETPTGRASISELRTVPSFTAPDFHSEAREQDEEVDFDLEAFLPARGSQRKYSTYAASRIEVILSPGELGLLRWYWEQGREVPGFPQARVVAGSNGEGSRRMAAQAGLVWNTFRNYTRSLSTKYAIDIVRPQGNSPRFYLVWHYRAILERIRKAGFTGVTHKNGGARELVDAESRPAPERPDLTVPELKRILTAAKLVTPKPGTVKSGTPSFGAENNDTDVQTYGTLSDKSGVPKFGTPIRNKEYPSSNELPSSSTGVPKIVAHALFERTGRTDADAVRSIVARCAAANATVTHDEIGRLIRGFQIPKSIANPVGLLITSLAARCVPESLANYRHQWRQQDELAAEAGRHERAEEERIARIMLNDPEATSEDKEWARSILAPNGEGDAA